MRSRVAQPLVVVIFSVFCLVSGTVEVAVGLEKPSLVGIIFPLALIAAFVASAWLEVFEFVFIASYIIFNLLGLIQCYELVGFGISFLMVFWLMRSWIVPVAVVFLVDSVLSVALSDIPDVQVVSSALDIFLVFTIGLAFRWQNRRLMLAEQEKERASLSLVKNRRELARQLHDTTAKDLAQLAVLAQDLATRHPELSDDLAPLVKSAIQASRRIRPMILSIDTSATQPSLSQVIQQVKQMLNTRSITLDVVAPEGVDNGLTRQQQLTGALAIRECASNVFKYAPVESEANLVVDVQAGSGILTISLSNEISGAPPVLEMSGGYGLSNLGDRIRSEGGTMEVSNVGGQWLIYITIPVDNRETTEFGNER
ncbi:sensor histidine kinase [Cutibacterium sp.]|uniref:sensor histidine kinase n=1 Tax=Cutibacterium sp. TaxID=1912221 RepID=UPI0026DD7B73|nr:hypothetical protein [Cutibacterium sp.]